MLSKPTRYCAGCSERLNPNAFPSGSGLCYPCRDKRKARERKTKGSATEMPSMLVAMKPHLDELERDSDWEHRFVTGLIERFESRTASFLSRKQFAKLDEIYRKYTDGQ